MTTYAQSIDKPRLKPVYLVEIVLNNGGPTLYFSDRNIKVGAQQYDNYIEEITGIQDEIRRMDSAFLNYDIRIKFKNEKWKTFDYLILANESYPFANASVTIKEVNLDDNNSPSDPATLIVGYLDEIEAIDDIESFICRISSILNHADREWDQPIVKTENWPYAWEDLGKVEPFGYGADIRVPCVRVNWGTKTTLKATITSSQTTLELSDKVLAARLPSGGFVLLIDAEKIYVGARSGASCSSCTRGYSSTTATVHSAGATVWEVKSQYDSLIADHDCHSIGDIYAEIEGELLRVTAGVSALYTGGKYLLRATSQITTEAVKEYIGVSNPTHLHTTVDSNKTIEVPLDNINLTGDWPHGDPNNCIDGNLNSYSIAETSGCIFSRIKPFEQAGLPVSMRLCCKSGSALYPDTATLTFVIPAVYSGGIWVGGSSSGTTYSGWKTISSWAQLNTAYASLSSSGKHVTIWDIWYEVIYAPPVSTTNIAQATAKTGGVVATYMVDRFHVHINLRKSPGADYGTVGSIIQRPDYVFKSFIVHKLGRNISEIDTTSFNAAGTSYASLTYNFAFYINKNIKPSQWLKQMAFECRSTVKFIAGKWYLDLIPSEPPASSATISKGEISEPGETFRFKETSVNDLKNQVEAKYKRDYSYLASNSESEWLGTTTRSSSTSIARYGKTYKMPVEFECIRTSAMANSVSDMIVQQRKDVLKTLSFPAVWDVFSLKAGDTFVISNVLYNGKKFFIERFGHEKGKAIIEAIEWWLASIENGLVDVTATVSGTDVQHYLEALLVSIAATVSGTDIQHYNQEDGVVTVTATVSGTDVKSGGGWGDSEWGSEFGT